MIVRADSGEDIVVLVPGNRRLSTKKVAAAVSERRVYMVPREEITKLTGYQVGAEKRPAVKPSERFVTLRSKRGCGLW